MANYLAPPPEPTPEPSGDEMKQQSSAHSEQAESMYTPSVAQSNYAPSITSHYVPTATHSRYVQSITASPPPAFTTQPQAQPQASAYPGPQPRPQPPVISQYRQHAPARDRVPSYLHNQDCGVPYKGIGAMFVGDHELVRTLIASQAFILFEVLVNIYFYRCNTVHGRGQLSRDKIRKLFGMEIYEYLFPLPEIYNRYLRRIGVMTKAGAASCNFWKLPDGEISAFVTWIKSITRWTKGGLQYELFEFGADRNGRRWLKIRAQTVTLNFIQMINAMHDSIRAWTDNYLGKEYIYHLAGRARFQYC